MFGLGEIHNFDRTENRPSKLFISYSRKDQYFLDRLLIHLTPIVRNGDVELWNDQQLLPGDNWSAEIEKKIDSSNIVIFMLSPNLLASKYVIEVELPKVLDRYANGQVKIVPILIKPCYYKNSEFERFLFLPIGNKPLSLFNDNDRAFCEVVNSLMNTILSHN